MYPSIAKANQILRALMSAKNWKQVDVKEELGFNQSEVSKIIAGEIGFTAKTEKLIDLYLESRLSDDEKREFGTEIFFLIHHDEIFELAKKVGWLPRLGGSSFELDQFLLPDGLEGEPNEAYAEWENALAFARQEYGKIV